MPCIFLSLQPHPILRAEEPARISTKKCQTIFPITRKRCFHLKELQQFHGQMIVAGFVHHTPSLTQFICLSLASDSAGLIYASLVFNHIQAPDIVIWNSLFIELVKQNMPELAISRYTEMLRQSLVSPDRFTFPSLLKGCTHSSNFRDGTVLHGQIVRLGLASDPYIETALVNLYAKSSDINSARILFGKMGSRNKVAWTSIITGYARSDDPKEALHMFNEMVKAGQEPDEVTMASVVSACGELKDLDCGRKLHDFIDKSGFKICVVLGTALVDMYMKCREPAIAGKLFDELPERNVVAWSAMISGFARNGQSNDALRMFKTMMTETSIKPNEVTILAVISACAQSGDLSLGRWVHAYMGRAGLNRVAPLQNGLIDMYSKCGKIEVAYTIFEQMTEKDVVSWNTMLGGFALHGLAERAVQLFSLMQKEGIQPDDLTFIGLLSACSHGGLVQEGLEYFDTMRRRYRVQPKLEHCGCIVDLLGRAGHLKQAEEFIAKMPMKPNGAIWGALLGSCRVHNNPELGERAAKELLLIEPQNDGVYVLLSNILAGKGKWDEVRRVRRLMHEKGIRKSPGCSSIGINGTAHEFFAGDRSHPESEEIHSMLNSVMEKLRLEGFVAETSEVLLNVDEEEKEDVMSQHSEKLAVCYGLMKTRPGKEIVIMKNLRICRDCHSAIKIISKVFQRKIIIRDRSRFHHFHGGSCSCRDYW